MATSRHWTDERAAREAAIRAIGMGEVIKSVTVDKGHANGPELHELSTTGIITIYNARTHKLVTKLIARPGQVRRYFEAGEAIPAWLLNIARDHQRLALNYT